MPELPEVNTFKRYFDESALHQKIARTTVFDDKIIRNMSGTAFEQLTQGRTFTGSYRRGKYLFARLDNGHDVLLHFGMTGDLNYYADEVDRSKYERFVFQFDNDFKLGFDCPRKFARILYLEDREAYIEEIKLGPDVLELSEEDFLVLTKKKKGSIKGFLLNQKYLAGMGNLYADEVCYQTKVHPASVVSAIPTKKRKAIYAKMQEVIRYAVDRNAYYKDYPEDWLWQWRDADAKAPDGSSVEIEKIGGRTTYSFPGWQKLYQ
ncbi:MAG TPA: DNA-formamidopyrimidine glycosylase family protein [Saprospiraceae bacterium]|nr:DNA-formamidopyrimidine glycosylase family protein [Saprospiraceae bacterium]